MTKRDYSQTFAKRSNTQERHALMRCVTRELKIKANTRTKREWLDRLFTEGKWVYNYYLQLHKAGDKWSKMPTRDNAVIVKYPMGYETRSLYTITSSMKQGIRDRLKTNEKSMLENIKNGNITHGELHYINTLDSIPLKQGCREGQKMQAYRLMDDHKHVKIQGDDRSWRVYGGHQIPHDAEIANGRLVRRNQNYYIQVTFFVEWDEHDLHDEWEIFERAFSLDGTGLDFGIESHITLSNGEKLNWWFEESDKLQAAQAANEAYRSWHKRKFGWARSSNAQLRVINSEYEKAYRCKQDAINKFVHLLRGSLVVVQREQLARWHSDGRYSGVVHHSIMGGIMARLLEQPSTLIVSEWSRTTGVCPDCGHVLEEKPDTSVREWDCPVCGARHDRDVAAARVIFLLGVVSLVYPVRPSVLDGGVWAGLLGVLGLDVPGTPDSVRGSGALNSERLRAATGIEH